MLCTCTLKHLISHIPHPSQVSALEIEDLERRLETATKLYNTNRSLIASLEAEMEGLRDQSTAMASLMEHAASDSASQAAAKLKVTLNKKAALQEQLAELLVEMDSLSGKLADKDDTVTGLQVDDCQWGGKDGVDNCCDVDV